MAEHLDDGSGPPDYSRIENIANGVGNWLVILLGVAAGFNYDTMTEDLGTWSGVVNWLGTCAWGFCAAAEYQRLRWWAATERVRVK